jgi:hypothetical protein
MNSTPTPQPVDPTRALLDALQVAREAIVSALPVQGPIPTNCDQLIDALYTVDSAIKAQKGA